MTSQYCQFVGGLTKKSINILLTCFISAQNTRRTRAIGEPDVDLRVVQVYKEFKLTGKGIRVVVLDDGLQHDHPDIHTNYVRLIGLLCKIVAKLPGKLF